MKMSNALERTAAKTLLRSEGAGNSVGNTMVLAGVGSLPVILTAMLLPGGLLFWFLFFVLGGLGVKAVSANKDSARF